MATRIATKRGIARPTRIAHGMAIFTGIINDYMMNGDPIGVFMR